LASGTLDIAPLIGLDTTLVAWKEAFEGMHASRVVKAVLRP